FPRRLQFLPRFHQRRGIDVDVEVKMWNRAEAFDQSLGNDSTHPGQLNARAFAGLYRRRNFSRRSSGFRFSCSAHIGLRYTAFRSSALHAEKVNAELGCNSASNRRRFHPRLLGLLDFRRWLFRFSFLFCLWWRRLFLLLLFRCRRFLFWLLRLRRLLFLLFFFFSFWLFLFFFLLFFLLLFFGCFLIFTTDEGNPIAHV